VHVICLTFVSTHVYFDNKIQFNRFLPVVNHHHFLSSSSTILITFYHHSSTDQWTAGIPQTLKEVNSLGTFRINVLMVDLSSFLIGSTFVIW